MAGSDSGQVSLAFGAPAGLSGSLGQPASERVLNGANAGDLAGASVAAAKDFNGDGTVDLAIGDTRYCERLSWVTGVMEFGFPSHFDHALYPRPTLGFEGWTCTLDRIAHALAAGRWSRPR